MKKFANWNESKWKFYKNFDFLVGSLTKKKNEFESVEKEQLFDFCWENEPLWNHYLKEYRDRNLWEAKLRELMEQFQRQFTLAQIKQQHNLLRNYKREKQRDESSKSSGSGSSENCTSSWSYYYLMLFTENTY